MAIYSLPSGSFPGDINWYNLDPVDCCLSIGKKFPSGYGSSCQDSLRIVLEPSEGHGEPVSSEPNLRRGTELDPTHYQMISIHVTSDQIISMHFRSHQFISDCFHIWIPQGVLINPQFESISTLSNSDLFAIGPKFGSSVGATQTFTLCLGRQRIFGHAGSIQYSIYSIWILTRL